MCKNSFIIFYKQKDLYYEIRDFLINDETRCRKGTLLTDIKPGIPEH